MSESSEKSSGFKSPAWVKSLIWVLIGVIIGIMVGYGIFTATLTKTVNDATTQIEQSVDTEAE